MLLVASMKNLFYNGVYQKGFFVLFFVFLFFFFPRAQPIDIGIPI